MSAKVKMNRDRWATVSGGGLSIDVYLSPMTRLEKIMCSETGNHGETRQTVEPILDERGQQIGERKTVSIIPIEGAQSKCTRYGLEHTITSWRDVVDEDSGQPITFSIDSLDRVMGMYPGFADALEAEVLKVNGMGRIEKPKLDGADPLAVNSSPVKPSEDLPSSSSGLDS